MDLAREHTDQARAEHIILWALNRKYRHVTDLKLFRINDKVWFHRNKFGWSLGEVIKVARPTIHVEHNAKIYPTHESRVRPFSRNQSLPPELNLDNPDAHGSIDKPRTIQDTDNDADRKEQNEEQQLSRRPTAISDLINGAFIVMNPVQDGSNSTILTDDNTILMNIGKSPRSIIDSTVIYHTEVENIKRMDTLVAEKQLKFKEPMREEIKFLLKNTAEVMEEKDRDTQCEIQQLKWVLSIKRSPNSEPPVRYRARLVSA